MKRFCRKGSVLLTAVSLSFSGSSFAQREQGDIQPMTQSTSMEVELLSNGGPNSYRLPDDVTQVDLSQQLRGGCRFGKSWGYDLSGKELWVNQGCGGRFHVTRSPQAANQGVGSNAGYAIAAVAAIAGLALIANQSNNNNRPNDNQGYSPPPQGGHGWQGGQAWQPGGQGGGQFRSVGGLCLDADKVNGRIGPGSAVQIWACNGGANQRFYWGRNGEIAIGNLCLDIADANPGDGGKMIVWPCSGARNQRWQARGRDIVSQLNGKCLAVWEGQARNGQRVVTWGCNGSANQNWWW
ncbi:MAG: lectin [Rhodoferax sp.]